ncbi:MAG: enoyl-CoA hydratase/isomerase family protein [Chloroflexi bacterium]|nr:MAG: enoyl-CoA hydratase/isomerase family protein [Chloroflexota bacterium]
MTTVQSEDREGGVRLLTLHRPPANAITAGLMADLASALEAAEADDSVRAVVLTGAGRFFSGGLDIRAPGLGEGLGGGNPFAPLRTAMLRLLGFPKPTIAMIGGHAIAGGLIIALACDYRLALDGDYRIGLNEVALGASFPRAAFETVRLRLTHQQASELLLGAAIYPASEAVRLGVAAELLSDDSFEETAMRRAARLGAFPSDAYAHTKLALVREALMRIEEETEEEAMRGAAVWMTPESVAARAAQAKKLAGGA